jgi:hypothetical protein
MTKPVQRIVQLDIASASSTRNLNELLTNGWWVVSMTAQHVQTTHHNFTVNGYIAVLIQKDSDA